ncbi:RME1 [Candida jiufengensis]|uniref:RME1 n=1 Tax=Candida jiufengensis TaxID=497108 RepID=UPI0022254306|nr:RME1 [Candida jiufengensis]KAI5951831.1 RME1 [Candida jiufengensis]
MSDIVGSIELVGAKLPNTPTGSNILKSPPLTDSFSLCDSPEFVTPKENFDEYFSKSSPNKLKDSFSSPIYYDFFTPNETNTVSNLQNLLDQSIEAKNPSYVPIPIIYNTQDDYSIPRSFEVSITSQSKIIKDVSTSLPKKDSIDELKEIFDNESFSTPSTSISTTPKQCLSPLRTKASALNSYKGSLVSHEYTYSKPPTNSQLRSPIKISSSTQQSPTNENKTETPTKITRVELPSSVGSSIKLQSPVQNPQRTISIDRTLFNNFKIELFLKFSESILKDTKVVESDLNGTLYSQNAGNYYDLISSFNFAQGSKFLKKREHRCPVIECPINLIGVKKRTDLRHHIHHEHLDHNRVCQDLESQYGNELRNELFVCEKPNCGKAFYRSDSLTRHSKLIHRPPQLVRATKRSSNVDNDPDYVDGGSGDKKAAKRRKI